MLILKFSQLREEYVSYKENILYIKYIHIYESCIYRFVEESDRYFLIEKQAYAEGL